MKAYAIYGPLKTEFEGRRFTPCTEILRALKIEFEGLGKFRPVGDLWSLQNRGALKIEFEGLDPVGDLQTPQNRV